MKNLRLSEVLGKIPTAQADSKSSNSTRGTRVTSGGDFFGYFYPFPDHSSTSFVFFFFFLKLFSIFGSFKLPSLSSLSCSHPRPYQEPLQFRILKSFQWWSIWCRNHWELSRFLGPTDSFWWGFGFSSILVTSRVFYFFSVIFSVFNSVRFIFI